MDGHIREQAMERTSVGKLVGGNLYVHRDATTQFGSVERALFDDARKRLPPSADMWNVVRVGLQEGDVSFLNYPTFDSDPFPALAGSWVVKADPSSSATFRDYSKSMNPPILHRKELLIALDDPRRERFAKTTVDAEALGLFSETARIGFQREWLARIAESGYELVGDSFVPLANASEPDEGGQATGQLTTDVERHRTALSRSTLSAPMQALARFGFLRPDWTVFDYGCGRGDDIRGLTREGFTAAGWDPHFAADAPRIESDVVNLGFVLNVIEDEDEREQAVRSAFALSRRVLSVAVMTDKVSSIAGSPFRDGYLTSRNTFQKYFSREVFQQFLESSLMRPVVIVAPGIAFVFPDDEAHESFLVTRQRSSRVWRRSNVMRPRRISVPKRGTRQDRLLDQANAAALQRFWCLMLQLGRVPLAEEAGDHLELLGIGGSVSNVARACMQVGDVADFEAARAERQNDTMVYFALRHLEKHGKPQPLTVSLREDVKVFFGTLAGALTAGADLLHRIASTASIQEACEQAAAEGLGVYTEKHSLQIHSSLVDALPPILRVYIGVGATLYGDVRSADIVKIHTTSGKLTLLEYEAFDASPAPLLNRRVKINLRTQTIDLFEYGGEYEKTVLLQKSRFLNEEHADFAEQAAFDERVRMLPYLFPEHGVTASEFAKILKANRLQMHGFSLIAATDLPAPDEPCGAWFTYGDFFKCGETMSAELLTNVPTSAESYNALNRLATKILDPVIDYFGSIKLTFGFCSAGLARAIKRRGVGRIAPTLDQHAAAETSARGTPICSRSGAAVDFFVPDEDMYEVAQWIADHLPFDRMYVYGQNLPIHVSYGPDCSGQITYVDRSSGKVRPRRIKALSEAPRPE